MKMSTMKTTSNIKTKDSKVMDALESKRTRCEVYTRVMWCHRPVSSYNQGKKSEFYSRKYYEANDSILR